MSTTTKTPDQYTKADFTSDQQVRWCPGCGDYAILNSVLTVFAKLGIEREKVAIISGIGCAARFPYYAETYGFHTIHGRAPAIASGLKISRPELSVWVVGGDGDMLSIGGNHLLHALRRNVAIKILCFNNRIYGLTKGQASPTSEVGKRTTSTPVGSLDRPINPISVALAAEATMVARTVDVYAQHLQDTLLRVAAHEGSAFVEILQNCVIFNDNAFGNVTERERRDETNLNLEHGKPLRFGKDGRKGIAMRKRKLEVVTIGEDGVTEDDLVVHDEKDSALAYMLSRMDPRTFPTPLGIFHADDSYVSYEKGVAGQIEQARAKSQPDLMKLIHQGDTWEVPAK